MKNKLITLSFSLLLIFQMAVTAAAQGVKAGYYLSKPDNLIILPDILKEVSGVTIIDNETVALIQDEKGIIYLFNLRENSIKKEIPFGENGDYEDLTLVNNDIYVLRSDGMLTCIAGFMTGNISVTKYKTGIPSDDIEGLCYDKAGDRLLIGCKGDIKKENFRNKRAVYAFDLKTKKLVPEPAYLFDARNPGMLPGIKAESKHKKDKEDNIELRISAIAINPKTGRLFVLSATDCMLFIAGAGNRIEAIENLDRNIFQQAEGIAFLPNGDMLITNEARNKKPSLLRFKFPQAK